MTGLNTIGKMKLVKLSEKMTSVIPFLHNHTICGMVIWTLRQPMLRFPLVVGFFHHLLLYSVCHLSEKSHPAVTFYGSQYLSYDLSSYGGAIISSNDKITLSFKTHQSNAMLFYTGTWQRLISDSKINEWWQQWLD